MNEIIKYFKINLMAEHSKNKDSHIFTFKYKNINCELIIKKINKICNPKLFIKNYEMFNHVDYNHIQNDGKACLSIYHNVLTHEETIIQVLDFCKTLDERTNSNIFHTHGYRHNFSGVVEEYFSLKNIPLSSKFIYKVDEKELFDIARQNDTYKDMPEEFLKYKWEELKKEWDEKMN